MLVSPGPVALAAIARRAGVPCDQITALTCTRDPIPFTVEQCFAPFAHGHTILQETHTLTELLSDYHPEKMDEREAFSGPAFFRSYFRQTLNRVHHAIEMLRELGVTKGRILDVGAFFGNFAAPLQRLGYEVTAVDRYTRYANAMPAHIRYLQSIGVNVIHTTREDEADKLAALGQFDAVLAMAVIEHIPHTPRFFLDMLASHVRPGGALLLDTPNIARYWARKALSEGRSVHQDIAIQFNTDIPYEGHHREYTLAEMQWMLGKAGAASVRGRLYDYNLLQFDCVAHEHIRALLMMTIDPAYADTISVGGAIQSGHVDQSSQALR